MSKIDIQKISTCCNNCRNDDFDVVAEGGDREYTDTTADSFRVVRCRHCGLHYLNPRPADAELSTIYPSHYHSYRLRGDAEGAPGVATRLRQWVYGLRLRKAFHGMETHRTLSLLDIGCGDGWMLDCFRAVSPVPLETFGVEINSDACQFAEAKGHRVFGGRFEEVDFSGRKFHLINISHVIEHVADPEAFLTKARGLLLPGGRIIIETPNLESVDGKLFRSGSWGAYHFPRHWFWYDPQSLRRVSDNAGLSLDRVYFHAGPVHWHWTFHNVLLKRLPSMARLFRPDLIFEGGLRTVGYLGIFTVLDQALKLARLPTSNMMAILSIAPERRS